MRKSWRPGLEGGLSIGQIKIDEIVKFDEIYLLKLIY